MNELQSLDDVFNKKIFRIPDYQRGYAWKEKQCVDFWEDLINLKPGRSHYTGVLSIKEVPSEKLDGWQDELWLINKRKYKGYHVVDGQQRLTTICILMQCLVEAIQDRFPDEKDDDNILLGSYSLKEIKERFLYIFEPPNNIVKSYKFGYEADNPSFKFLRYKILKEPNPGTVEETFYTLNLQNSKKFFKDNINKAVKEHGFDYLEEIYDKVTQRLMFNLYELHDDFDVFVAFETMNNRGKPLSNLELLKNRLIYLTTLYDDHEVSETDRIKVRDNINDAWKEVYHQLGRNKEAPLNDDDFLRAHWILYFKYSRKKGNDYINFLLDEVFSPNNVLEKTIVTTDGLTKIEELREYFDDDSDFLEEDLEEGLEAPKLKITEINTYVLSLKSSAVHWYNIHNPTNNVDLTEEDQSNLECLNRVGPGYFRPLLMSLYVTRDVDHDDRIELLQEIERFVFITFRINRFNASYRNSVYFNFAREFYNGRISIQEIIDKLDDDMYWAYEEDGTFNMTSFKEHISQKFRGEGTGFYGWRGLRFFLYEYEEELKKLRNQPKISWPNFIKSKKDKLSIEHVYPQTPNDECWTDLFDEFTKEQQNLLRGSLGNLLPLSMSINSSLQNDCFKDKINLKQNSKGETTRNGYKNGSYSEQEVAANQQWGPQEIKERGLKLLEFMEQRWDIDFGSEENRLELLHLQFLSEDNNKE